VTALVSFVELRPLISLGFNAPNKMSLMAERPA